MPTQHHGYCWPDAAGTPTDPTVAYAVDGVAMYCQLATKIYFAVDVAGTACTAIQLEVSLGNMIAGTLAWGEVSEISVIGAGVGTHLCVFEAPESSWVRVSARRVGGDANTTVTIWGELRRLGTETIGVDRQPPELFGAQRDGVILWDNGAGAADATGNAYALGPAGTGHWTPVGCATEWVLRATLTGGPSTTIELMIEESPDMTTVSGFQEVVSSVSAGIDRRQPAEVQINGANGSYLVQLQTRPGSYLRVWAKDTGASSNMIVRGYPYRVGA